jgi:hypothetical protein
MPSGKRFFLVQYRRHGRTRRAMIGLFSIVTVELALSAMNSRRFIGSPHALPADFATDDIAE